VVVKRRGMNGTIVRKSKMKQTNGGVVGDAWEQVELGIRSSVVVAVGGVEVVEDIHKRGIAFLEESSALADDFDLEPRD
jgi:hypothetical protein